MNGLLDYSAQSVVTDPGRMAGWLADLPSDVLALRRIARGLVVHYRGEDLAALGIAEARLEEIDDTRGWPYLRHNLIHDLAALNSRELLLWDSWGLMESGAVTAVDLALLDLVAEMTRAPEPVGDTVQGLYEGEPGLRVPETVMSYSPATGVPREVTIRS